MGAQEFAQAICSARLEEEESCGKPGACPVCRPPMPPFPQRLTQLRTHKGTMRGYAAGPTSSIASLPLRMGARNPISVVVAPAAFRASLPMFEKRLPPLAGEITAILEGEQVGGGCLGELQLATRVWIEGGFVSRSLEHVLSSNTC